MSVYSNNSELYDFVNTVGPRIEAQDRNVRDVKETPKESL